MKKPIVAICYDFDKTLTPDDMQAQGFIQSLGIDVPDFWKSVDVLSRDNEMDRNLGYMYRMLEDSRGIHVMTKDTLKKFGAKVELFPGVEDWFERINAYGDLLGIEVEHYIISSGIKEMIEGNVLGQKGVFKRIYASSFLYNDEGVAVWPAQAINYTNKTQFLFRIEKGVLDVYDERVNDSYDQSAVRVPFEHMIYIGDSDTDIPCMKLVNERGGYSIGVYDNDTSKVQRMLKDKRIRYHHSADYREGKELDTLMKAIINKISTDTVLENEYDRNLADLK